MDKNLQEFWNEICLPENQDIQDNLFRLDYTTKDIPKDDNRFEEIIDELEDFEESKEHFPSMKDYWELTYVIKNTEWLFVVAGNVYGIIFDNILVMRGTETDFYNIAIPLYDYPFRKSGEESWEEIIEEGETWCENYREILNKYFIICEKYGYKPSLPKDNIETMSEEEFNEKVFKDFKE